MSRDLKEIVIKGKRYFYEGFGELPSYLSKGKVNVYTIKIYDENKERKTSLIIQIPEEYQMPKIANIYTEGYIKGYVNGVSDNAFD